MFGRPPCASARVVVLPSTLWISLTARLPWLHHHRRGVSRRNYYEVLQVSKTADEATIKRAYRKLAVKWHPVRTSPLDTLTRTPVC